MIVKIDSSACIGCGLCPELCPDVFEMNADVAVVKVATVPPDAEAACRNAADECPVSAISVE